MATPPRWQPLQFNAPDVSRYIASAGDLFNQAVDYAKGGAKAYRDKLTTENTSKIMQDIQDISTLDDYDAQKAELQSKLASYGSLVDTEKASAALAGRDEAIFDAAKQTKERSDYSTRIANEPAVSGLKTKLAEAARTGNTALYTEALGEYGTLRSSLLPETASSLDSLLATTQAGIRDEEAYQLGLSNTASANNLASSRAYLSRPDTTLTNLKPRIEAVRETEEYKGMNPTDRQTFEEFASGLSSTLQERSLTADTFNEAQRTKATDDYLATNFGGAGLRTLTLEEQTQAQQDLGEMFSSTAFKKYLDDAKAAQQRDTQILAEAESGLQRYINETFTDTDFLTADANDAAKAAAIDARAELAQLNLSEADQIELTKALLEAGRTQSTWGDLSDDFSTELFNKALARAKLELSAKSGNVDSAIKRLQAIAADTRQRRNADTAEPGGA